MGYGGKQVQGSSSGQTPASASASASGTPGKRTRTQTLPVRPAGAGFNERDFEPSGGRVDELPAGGLRLWNFLVDKSSLRPEHTAAVGDLAARLLGPDTRSIVIIQGHTSASGSEKHNTGLSLLRAYQVVEALVAAGVPRARLFASGFGETNLLAQEDDTEAMAHNRRVEVMILRMSAPASKAPPTPAVRPPPDEKDITSCDSVDYYLREARALNDAWTMAFAKRIRSGLGGALRMSTTFQVDWVDWKTAFERRGFSTDYAMKSFRTGQSRAAAPDGDARWMAQTALVIKDMEKVKEQHACNPDLPFEPPKPIPLDPITDQPMTPLPDVDIEENGKMK